ncbi:hypothetical protein D1872_159420 [compost metagenome]
MLDYFLQAFLQQLRKLFYVLLMIYLAVIANFQCQHACCNHAVHIQRLLQHGITTHRLSVRMRRQHDVTLFQILIKLSQIVKADLRLQIQGRIGIIRRHVLQNTVANALMRHMTQVLFYPLDALPYFRLSIDIQQHGILTCKPAHGTCNIHIWNNSFPAMPLQIDQHTFLTAPVVQCAAECG